MDNIHTITMFNDDHLYIVSAAIVITIMFFALATLFNKRKYGIFLGYFIIIVKIGDILIRVFIEKYPPLEALPFHLCNVGILLSGIYLITKNKYIYTVIFCWSYGAILTLIIPTTFNFTTRMYILFFFLTHSMILLSVIYGKVYYKHKVTIKGYTLAIILFVLLALNARYWNNRLGTNFMYVNNYILPFLKFMEFKIYLIIYISLHILTISLFYLIGKKIK